MVLDLTLCGWSRQGKIECSQCAVTHELEIKQERRGKLADPIYRSDINGPLTCDCCGKLLDAKAS